MIDDTLYVYTCSLLLDSIVTVPKNGLECSIDQTQRTFKNQLFLVDQIRLLCVVTSRQAHCTGRGPKLRNKYNL